VKGWTIAISAVVAVAVLFLIRQRRSDSPAVGPTYGHDSATVLRDVIAREDGVHVDVYLPAGRPAPWMIFAEDHRCPGIAVEMQRRGVAVALVSTKAENPGENQTQLTERFAKVMRDLATLPKRLSLAEKPVLAGAFDAAAMVALLALDDHYDLGARIAGVITMNGTYEAPIRYARAGPPPFLILSAHAEPPDRAQSARAFARALERAGATSVRSYHVTSRDEIALCDLSGERNDIADLLVSFVRSEPAPGGAESAWAIRDAWGARAPLSTEPFWRDERLVERMPVDDHLLAHLGRVFATSMRELDPWPRKTYDAIDLEKYLAAHPEVGAGDFLEVINVRNEQLVLTRDEIRTEKPLIVVGLDDEQNLFRLLVTYNVYRSYTFKPESEPRPLLARPVGAFLHFPHGSDSAPRVVTFADFALTISSFCLVKVDPLAAVRSLPKAVEQALTDSQGCLQCHSLRGAGSRSHHIRALDGKSTGGDALAFEDYPRDVLRRFLLDQDQVAEIFGVAPISLEKSSAALLLQELTR
jgi:hypothetical protein